MSLYICDNNFWYSVHLYINVVIVISNTAITSLEWRVFNVKYSESKMPFFVKQSFGCWAIFSRKFSIKLFPKIVETSG